MLSYIHWKTKNDICNNTSDGRSSIIVGEEKLSEEVFGDSGHGFKELAINNISGLIQGETVRNGFEMKGGKLGGEAGEIVGDVTVVVVGVEEGDSETGIAEEVGET